MGSPGWRKEKCVENYGSFSSRAKMHGKSFVCMHHEGLEVDLVGGIR